MVSRMSPGALCAAMTLYVSAACADDVQTENDAFRQVLGTQTTWVCDVDGTLDYFQITPVGDGEYLGTGRLNHMKVSYDSGVLTADWLPAAVYQIDGSDLSGIREGVIETGTCIEISSNIRDSIMLGASSIINGGVLIQMRPPPREPEPFDLAVCEAAIVSFSEEMLAAAQARSQGSDRIEMTLARFRASQTLDDACLDRS